MTDRARVGVLPIQEVVANASPSAWRDGLVIAVEPGATTVALLDGTVCDLTTSVSPALGEPVAVHPVADLLAVAGTWYAARPLSA